MAEGGEEWKKVISAEFYIESRDVWRGERGRRKWRKGKTGERNDREGKILGEA